MTLKIELKTLSRIQKKEKKENIKQGKECEETPTTEYLG